MSIWTRFSSDWTGQKQLSTVPASPLYYDRGQQKAIYIAYLFWDKPTDPNETFLKITRRRLLIMLISRNQFHLQRHGSYRKLILSVFSDFLMWKWPVNQVLLRKIHKKTGPRFVCMLWFFMMTRKLRSRLFCLTAMAPTIPEAWRKNMFAYVFHQNEGSTVSGMPQMWMEALFQTNLINITTIRHAYADMSIIKGISLEGIDMSEVIVVTSGKGGVGKPHDSKHRNGACPNGQASCYD